MIQKPRKVSDDETRTDKAPRKTGLGIKRQIKWLGLPMTSLGTVRYT